MQAWRNGSRNRLKSDFLIEWEFKSPRLHMLSIEQTDAMEELTHHGLTFCVYFGIENAVERLAELHRAEREGRLYEWLNERLGIVLL